MKINEVRSIAKKLELKTARLSKAAMILAIQEAEGNIQCFSKGIANDCQQLDCLWREDCFTAAKKL